MFNGSKKRTSNCSWKKIAEIAGENDFVLASSDFSHYVPMETAYKEDLKAIDDITNLDIDSFYEKINSGLSACGSGPIIAAMQFAIEKKAKGKLLKYATSGDVQPMNEVVGYASIIFK